MNSQNETNRWRLGSKDIKSIAYDQKRQWLEIEFEGGAIYRFSDVPFLEFKSILHESAGKHAIIDRLTRAFHAERYL